MADVTGRSDAAGRPDRGQLIVVAGLLISVLFVGLALVLNSGIYAENLATRDTNGDTRNGLEERHKVTVSTAEAIDRTNANFSTTDYDTVEDALDRVVDNETARREAARAEWGTHLEVERQEPVRGTRVRQTDTARNFTDRNGSPDWNLTSGPTDGGQVTMNIGAGSLFESSYDTSFSLLGESAFALEFYPEDGPDPSEGDGVWRIFVFQGAATNALYAVVEHPDQDFQEEEGVDHLSEGWIEQACSMRGDTLTMRVDQQQFGGVHCEEFGFYEDLGEHTLGFTNAYSEEVDLADEVIGGEDVDRAHGSYDILLEGEIANSTALHTPSGDEQPFHQAAVFSQNVSITHQTSETTYTVEEHRVVPHERETGGILWEFPRIEVFEPEQVADDEYEVTWRAQHQLGNLDNASLVLVDSTTDDVELLDGTTVPLDGNEIVDSVSYDASGPSADGHDTLADPGAAGGSYVVLLSVEDESGRTTIASREFEVT